MSSKAQPLRVSASKVIGRAADSVLPRSFVTRHRTARRWRDWIDALTPEILDNLSKASPETKRRVFKANVCLVEIETHAKCNRICPFCPNVVMDRRRNTLRTDPTMLETVFAQLGSIDYAGQIKVARYSEPLADPDSLCASLAAARRLVPKARLSVVTNTDYLTRPLLDRLVRSGLDLLWMSIYLAPNESWTPSVARRYNQELARKLGVVVEREETSATSMMCRFSTDGFELWSACHDWDSHGTDRGGSVPQYADRVRVGPCREPFETFVIDYTGAVMPCCALRSDLPEQASYALGSLLAPGASIFDIYAGRLSAWRRSMVGFGPKASPCATCRHGDVPAELVPSLSKRLERRLFRIGRPAGGRTQVRPAEARRVGDSIGRTDASS